MSVKNWIGFWMLVALMAFIGGVCEMATYGESEVGVIQTIMTQPNITSSTGVLGTATAWIGWTGDVIGAIWSAFWFDYPMFQGEWLNFKYLFFAAIGLGFAIPLGLALFRGVSSD